LTGRRVAVAQRFRHRRLGERAHSGPDAGLADLERETHAAHLARLGQQALDRELEVVDLLEGEVHALRDPADDQPYHGLEVARQRRLQDDAFARLRHVGSPIVPSPTTRS
jgi:hypothetical protein